jgi:hypothetical protein
VGTAVAGLAGPAAAATATGRPHSSQNFAAGRRGVAQEAHTRGSAVPQLSQNLAAARLSAPHEAQVIPLSYARGPATPRTQEALFSAP